jgi:hypothetical protein
MSTYQPQPGVHQRPPSANIPSIAEQRRIWPTDHVVRGNAALAAFSGTEGSPCANCGRQDHRLARCVGPVNANGVIDGCPIHNTQWHDYSECWHINAHTEKSQDVWLFVNRIGIPQIAGNYAPLPKRQGQMGPLTPAEALNSRYVLQHERVIYGTNFAADWGRMPYYLRPRTYHPSNPRPPTPPQPSTRSERDDGRRYSTPLQRSTRLQRDDGQRYSTQQQHRTYQERDDGRRYSTPLQRSTRLERDDGRRYSTPRQHSTHLERDAESRYSTLRQHSTHLERDADPRYTTPRQYSTHLERDAEPRYFNQLQSGTFLERDARPSYFDHHQEPSTHLEREAGLRYVNQLQPGTHLERDAEPRYFNQPQSGTFLERDAGPRYFNPTREVPQGTSVARALAIEQMHIALASLPQEHMDKIAAAAESLKRCYDDGDDRPAKRSRIASPPPKHPRQQSEAIEMGSGPNLASRVRHPSRQDNRAQGSFATSTSRPAAAEHRPATYPVKPAIPRAGRRIHPKKDGKWDFRPPC